MSPRQLNTELLLQAGRLLLEYNESTEAIHRALTETARALTEETCHVAVSYRGVAASTASRRARAAEASSLSRRSSFRISCTRASTAVL